jgi:hypothetical protein
MKFILCALVGKLRNEKYMFSLSLELVKVGSYDFPTHVMAPKQSPLFKRPSVDIVFHMLIYNNHAVANHRGNTTIAPALLKI